MKPGHLLILLSVVFLLFSAGDLFAEGQVVIEESIKSSGSIGGGASIGNRGAGVHIRINPETRIERKTTITTRGNISVYSYKPGCYPPCHYDYCYPSTHQCAGCNKYHRSPCPNIETKP